MTNDSILKKLTSGDIKFSKSDKKILDYIGNDYRRMTQMSIQTLAEHSDVSEPTINRLAKKLGCKGFPDLKMRIVEEISKLHQVKKIQLNVQNDSAVTRDKILDVISQSINSLKYSTTIEQIEKAVELFYNAKKISFFGLGASSSVSLDAQHKCLRLGIPTYTQNDYINQQMLSTTLDQGDLICLISYSGQTKQTIAIAEIAKKNNIPCISITRSNSKLAQLSDVVLNAETSIEENSGMPMTSRIIHLVIIDILTTLLIQKKELVSAQNINKIQQQISTE